MVQWRVPLKITQPFKTVQFHSSKSLLKCFEPPQWDEIFRLYSDPKVCYRLSNCTDRKVVFADRIRVCVLKNPFNERHWISSFWIDTGVLYQIPARLLNADWPRRRAFFINITRALLVILRAWLLYAASLSTPALSWFPALNCFWKGNFQKRFWFDLNTLTLP